MFWIPLAMAAMSLAKEGQDEAAQKRSQFVEAAKARYSPWTGIKPGSVEYAKPASNMMQGLGSILSYQQGKSRNDALNKLLGGGGNAEKNKALMSTDGSPGFEPSAALQGLPGQDGTGTNGGVLSDDENNMLEKLMKKMLASNGSSSAWSAMGDGPESQPTPILGGGLTGGMGSLFS